MLAAIMVLVASAAAQTPATPTPPVIPPTAAPEASSGGGGGSVAISIGLLAGLVLLIAVGGKLLDLRRKRQSEAVHLQAQASDAVLRDAALASYPITPTAHVPFWRGGPATIVVSGQIPSPDLRQMVLRIVQQEAMRIRPDVTVEDRLTVVPSTLQRAA
ncbi:MAG TPA: hypothetical protein VGX21_12875 [Methylomirabilota bacterium]|nr:hypothetical protein [Methylomirabilota bacterium]